MMSTADTCVIPVQDYLGLGEEARLNHPSTLGSNWTWRLLPGVLTGELAEKIYRLTRISARLPEDLRILEAQKREQRRLERETQERQSREKACSAPEGTGRAEEIL